MDAEMPTGLNVKVKDHEENNISYVMHSNSFRMRSIVCRL